MKVLGWGNALLYVAALIAAVILASTTTPEPPGKLVDVGGHRLHVNCTGKGGPLIVVENGLGDFSFDWFMVQSRISNLTRICTYDRDFSGFSVGLTFLPNYCALKDLTLYPARLFAQSNQEHGHLLEYFLNCHNSSAKIHLAIFFRSPVEGYLPTYGTFLDSKVSR